MSDPELLTELSPTELDMLRKVPGNIRRIFMILVGFYFFNQCTLNNCVKITRTTNFCYYLYVFISK